MLPWMAWNLIYAPGRLQTYGNPTAPASWVMGLQACAAIPNGQQFITR